MVSFDIEFVVGDADADADVVGDDASDDVGGLVMEEDFSLDVSILGLAVVLVFPTSVDGATVEVVEVVEALLYNLNMEDMAA